MKENIHPIHLAWLRNTQKNIEEEINRLQDKNCDYMYKNLPFEEALKYLKNGSVVTRSSFGYGDKSIMIHETEVGIIFVMHKKNEKTVAWMPIMEDILATDWEVIT